MSMNHSLAVKVLAFKLQVIIYNTYGFVLFVCFHFNKYIFKLP